MNTNKEWRGINDLYYHQSRKDQQNQTPAAAENEPAPRQKKEEQEVRLLEPAWSPGADGYQFNKKCKVRVKVEYKKETSRKKVTFKLFSIYNNEEEDLAHQADGYEEKGIAEAELTLFYGDKYSKALQKDPEAKCRYKFKASHATGGKEIESELLEMPAEEKHTVNAIEISGDIFSKNSAVPCLDNQNNLFNSIITAFEYAQEHQDEEVTIFGHTDVTNEAELNYSLSEKRAKAIKALLDDDSDTWCSIAQSQSNTEDFQTILKTLSSVYGWSCDPGPVDNKEGEKTKKGILAFQAEYNASSGDNIKESGTIDTPTLKALFAVIRSILAEVHKNVTGKEQIPSLNYSQKTSGIYACGEAFPISSENKKNYISKSNRRCEFIFTKKDDAPKIEKINAKDTTTDKASLCEVFSKAKCYFRVKGIEKVKQKQIPKHKKIEVVYPEKTPHNQYVNLTPNNKEQGHELQMKVKVINGEDNQKVYWNVSADSNNSKRNDPKTGIKKPGDAACTEFADKTAALTTTVTGQHSEAILCCGYAGGDTYTVEVGLVENKYLLSFKVVNWRKLWYQRTFHQDADILGMNTVERNLKDVYVEFTVEPDKKHNNPKRDGAIIIGNHNTATYHAMLASTHPNQCVHIIFCDKQYDGKSGGSNITVTKNDSLTSSTKTIRVGSEDPKRELFNPPLQEGAKFLVSGTWENANDGTKNGTLTDDPAGTDADTGLVEYVNKDNVKVTLPANANAAADNPVNVMIEVTAASGPWGGDGGTAPHNLVVIDDDDTIHSMCVMHEFGHLMNMVPYQNSDGDVYYNCPPGFVFADHTHSYDKMGGAGSHCSYEHNTKKSTVTKYVDGRCIMFHQLSYNCRLYYCKDCNTLIKAQKLTAFQDLKP